jgi:thiol-disulfide isomerase/thioredoxin
MPSLPTLSLLLAAVTLFAAACGTPTPSATADGEAEPNPDAADRIRQLYGIEDVLLPGDRAPEFEGLTDWRNGEPTSLAALAGQRRVVLVDFWTYTCVNCIRTLPFVRDWHRKYGDRGLTVVGVHSPEFDFEKRPENVSAAVERYALEYLVAQDNEMRTWRAFHNHFWPAKYLIGVEGVVRYVHFGEGEYEETEQAIRDALEDAGHDVSDIAAGGVEAPERDDEAQAVTSELYGGYARNYGSSPQAGQDAYYEGPDRTVEYVDPGDRRHNTWYVRGLWRNEREAIVHARATERLEDYLAFRFVARSVNVVMHPAAGVAGEGAEGEPYEVYVELDGRPLRREEAGADVTWDGEGRSLVRVDEPRMYALVELPEHGDHGLRLRSNAEGFSMYAVTFGAYEEGP